MVLDAIDPFWYRLCSLLVYHLEINNFCFHTLKIQAANRVRDLKTSDFDLIGLKLALVESRTKMLYRLRIFGRTCSRHGTFLRIDSQSRKQNLTILIKNYFVHYSTMMQQLLFPCFLLWLCLGLQSISVLSLTTNNNGPTRRDFVNTGIIGTAGLLELSSFPLVSLAADGDGASSKLPFCVIGANGKTGTKCVQDILGRGMPVRATSRGGVYYEAEESDAMKTNPLLIPTVCDVTVPSTVDAAVKGTRAVIFAASASKQGGTPSEVDNVGLKNVATACIANGIPHLVIVSSGGVSKPDSPIYKFLNVFGGIMEEKIKGEDTVRSMYANLKDESGKLTYTIIRPGGLTEEPIRGVSEIALNQGDIKSGRISRYDLAKLCVEATFYPELTGSTTFECYDADTGKELGSVGMSNLFKKKTASSEISLSEKERVGQSYKALFTGLEKGVV